MCNSILAVVLFVLFCLPATDASFPDAESAIRVPRRSASLYWVNRALPNKFKKYRTFSALQSMGPDEKKRFSSGFQQRFEQLVQLP